jgi:hypothetical protein
MLKHITASLALALICCALGVPAQASNKPTATCTPTGYIKDNINLTAAYFAGNYSGQDLDATGCNIGVYFGPGTSGAVDTSSVHGANYFGILINGATVTVTDSNIHDIGEVPFNGTQHGVGVYCASSASSSRVLITGNRIWNYQKGGMAVLGSSCSNALISYNTVTGLGPIDFIAQNGIEWGLGTQLVQVEYNAVSGNSYTGSGGASSGGLLAFGGPCFAGPNQTQSTVEGNVLNGNDVGIYDYDLNAACTSAAPHNGYNLVRTNNVYYDTITNQTGNGTGPYQVGVAVGDWHPHVNTNNICGAGYNSAPPPGGFIAPIDTTGSVGTAQIKSSNTCSAPPKGNEGSRASMVAAMVPPTAEMAKRIQPYR